MSAIANYTQRVVDTSLSAKQRQEALKFLSKFSAILRVNTVLRHPCSSCELLSNNEISAQRWLWDDLQFVGDIGQPLHNEAFALGGNEIDVQCDGKSINLHAVGPS